MKGVNKVILLGVIGKDPEIIFSQNGNQVANLSVATNAQFKDKRTGEKQQKTTWHSCVAFGKTAEIIGQIVTKGGKIYIDGSLDNQQYEKDGETRYTTKIIIRDFNLISSSKDNQAQREPNGNLRPQEPIDDDIAF